METAQEQHNKHDIRYRCGKARLDELEAEGITERGSKPFTILGMS
jgi:hypothetical protein